MTFAEFKNTMQRVRAYLETWPTLKDNDYKLIASYWKFELGPDINKMTAIEFLQVLADKKITHPESIRRCRAKLQKDNPDLRGESYRGRGDQGKEFTASINTEL